MKEFINQSDQVTHHVSNGGYYAYGVVMFFILTVGFIGNIMTLVVLYQHEHRRRTMTPLMLNLALADIFIIVFGYPVAMQANLRGMLLESSHCSWGGFVNGAVGISSIFTLTEMSVVSYYGLKRVNSSSRQSASQVACLMGVAWIYGVLCMLPPLLGWNRFVLSASKISCCPDWSGKSASDTAYNLLLVFFGFFGPLTAMIICYYKIYSLVHSVVVPGNLQIQLRQRQSELKIVKMTAMNVAAFLVSWAPYCCVSLVAVFTKTFMLEDWEAEIPELLAKASVIYNPIIYTTMYRRFRATQFRLLHFRRRLISPQIATVITRNHFSSRLAADRPRGAPSIDQRYLQVPSQAMAKRGSVKNGSGATRTRQESSRIFVHW
ncbi:rhodopsin-like [Montipora capricornis]|uniref:rhodopsin-like n=1 Tax=Montipora capricornis TaxID=246305 RepID=UPI0035F12A00